METKKPHMRNLIIGGVARLARKQWEKRSPGRPMCQLFQLWRLSIYTAADGS